MPVSAKLELGHSLKTEPDTAGLGNTGFGQIFSLCYRETFPLLPRLDVVVCTSPLCLQQHLSPFAGTEKINKKTLFSTAKSTLNITQRASWKPFQCSTSLMRRG